MEKAKVLKLNETMQPGKQIWLELREAAGPVEDGGRCAGGV